MAKIPKKITNEIEIINNTAGTLVPMDIRGIESFNTAVALYDWADTKLKEIELKKKEIVDPIKIGLENVKELFEQPINTLKGIILDIRPKIANYLALQKGNIPDRDKTRLEEIDELLNSSNDVNELAELSVEKQSLLGRNQDLALTHKDVISTRKLWKFKVTRIEDIPLQFMTTNDIVINKFIRETQGSMEVPGIEIYQEEIITKARG